LLGLPGLDRLVEPSQAVEAFGDSAQAEGEVSHLSQSLDQGRLFPQDLQGLLMLTLSVENGRDLPDRDRCGARLSKHLVDWELLSLPDKHGGIEVPLRLEDVGSHSQSDSSQADILGPFKCR